MHTSVVYNGSMQDAYEDRPGDEGLYYPGFHACCREAATYTAQICL